MTIRWRAVRGRVSPAPSRTEPNGGEPNVDARVRSAPDLGSARRRGLASFGAEDWLRLARGPARIGPRTAQGRTEPHETCTLGFARRRGSGPVGAGDWVRLAPGLGFARRPDGPIAGGPAPRPLSARSRTGVDERRTLGFAREPPTGSGSGAGDWVRSVGGSGSVGAGSRVRSADRPAARRPLPGSKRTHDPRSSTEQSFLFIRGESIERTSVVGPASAGPTMRRRGSREGDETGRGVLYSSLSGRAEPREMVPSSPPTRSRHAARGPRSSPAPPTSTQGGRPARGGRSAGSGWGEGGFELVEEVRGTAKGLRADSSVEEARRLRDRLGQLDLPELRTLIRAFSVYFDLINLAEQQARVRALRSRQREAGSTPQVESPGAALRGLRDRGVKAEEVAEHLGRALICPVFTAHPSEARRRTILGKIAAIAHQLDRLERGDLVPAERTRAVDAIAEEVETLWLSDIIREVRPTVLDEVRHCLNVVEGSLLDVVPRVYRTIEASLRETYPGHEWRVPPFLRFGSWIGGDRDGHPGVSPRTNGRGRPAPAGDLAPPLPDPDGRPLVATEPLGSVHTAWGGPARVDREGRRALPRTARRDGARAVSGEVPADLRQAPPDPRIRPVDPALDGRGPPAIARRLPRPRGAARRPFPDRRRPGAGRRTRRRGRGDPRHDPARRGLRRPPPHPRPPPAQRPARLSPRRDPPMRRGLPGLHRALARRSARRPRAGAGEHPAARPDAPGLLRRDERGRRDIPHDRRDPGATEPRGAEHLHHQLDDRARPPPRSPPPGPRGEALPAGGGGESAGYRPALRGAGAAPDGLGDHGQALRAAGLPAPPGAARGAPGGDDRVLRQQQGERLPPVGLGPLPGCRSISWRRAAGRGSRCRCSTAGAGRSAGAAGRPTAPSSRSRGGRSTAGSG